LIGFAGSGTALTAVSGCSVNLTNDLIISSTSNNTATNNEAQTFGGMIGLMGGLAGPALTNVQNNTFTCRNLTLTGPTITGKNNITTFNYFGGFGGNMDFNNTYDNCVVNITQMTVTYNDTSTGAGTGQRIIYIGGFAGAQTTPIASIIQSTTVNIGTFNISFNSGSLTYFSYIAGFVGFCDSNPGIITNSTNSTCIITTLSVTTSTLGVGTSNIGGCFGFVRRGTIANVDCTIQNSTFSLNEGLTTIYSGGYIGYTFSTNTSQSSLSIPGTFSLSNISTRFTYGSGFIGYLDGDTSNSMTNCSTNINTFNFVSNGTYPNFVNWIGGFIGRILLSTQSVSSCSATITNENFTLTSSGVAGDNRVGCVIGENDSASISSITSNITSAVVNISDSNSAIIFGGLMGLNFGSTTQTCNTTISSLTVQNTLTSQQVWMGGVFGQASSSSNILNNTTNITTLSLTGRSTGIVLLAGLVAGTYLTSAIQGCITTIGQNALLECTSSSTRNNISGLIGEFISSGTVLNNSITYGNSATFKSNATVTDIRINAVADTTTQSISSTNTCFLTTFPLILTVTNIDGTNLVINGNSYPIIPILVSITNARYTIQLTNVTFNIITSSSDLQNSGVVPDPAQFDTVIAETPITPTTIVDLNTLGVDTAVLVELPLQERITQVSLIAETVFAEKSDIQTFAVESSSIGLGTATPIVLLVKESTPTSEPVIIPPLRTAETSFYAL